MVGIEFMMQRFQMDYLRERMRREEARAVEFHERTKLPISEMTMVVLPSGNAYPHWKGALRAMRPYPPED